MVRGDASTETGGCRRVFGADPAQILLNSSRPAGLVSTENATENQNKPPTDSEQAAPTVRDSPDASASGWVQASRFSYVGIFFGVAVFLGFLFGRWLDRKFGTDPWLMLVGVLFGIASGFKELYRLTASYRSEQKKKP